ncbi:HNH endonuclease [Devosia aurantiaca]|uniref:HNH endonuclease n=1 Tax=Devosia aurantiaca TaxID=2714858 RepID=A0A6M1SR87_9HYPH|nr:HNH endonuclease [Devosia aurantiaca]NGP19154.1 HNH endonuclease [Devosia aurantiaca]
MRTAKLKEWVGRRPESMPGQTVLFRLHAKQGGICACGCGQVMNFNVDKIDCDHIVALIDGGENRESNLQLLLNACHKVKTAAEASARSEERKHKAKAFTALRRPKRGAGFPKAEPQRSATRKIEKWSLLS